MRVCFLLHELARSGGVEVIAGHARRLPALGIEADVVVTGSEPAGGAISLGDARGRDYDVAVATWWETIGPLYELSPRRRAVFLQSIESGFYGEDEPFELAGTALALALPAEYLAVSSWVAGELERRNPHARCRVVPNGIDKAVFAPRGDPLRAEGPLRVLVEGQPSLPFKGIRESLEAVRAMSHPAQVTLAALDVEQARDAGFVVDRIVGGLDAAGMAALYAEHDVLLKLSRFEGLGLPALEAFHVGVPAVITPYGGHVDYAVDGDNALIVPLDDVPAAAALDRLAADRDLLARLSRGALETAAHWPSLDESTDQLADALREIATAAPEPDPRADLAVRTALASIAAGRERFPGLISALRWNEEAFASARAHVEELSRSRDDCAAMLEAERRKLEALKLTRTYRAAETARRLLRGR